MIKYTETMLVFQIRQGDKLAFQQLYSRYHTALLGIIQQIVKDPAEAEDLLQDTYVKVWQRFHYYDPEQGGLFNWLLNVARNTALDSIRRRKLICLTLDADMLSVAMVYRPVTDVIDVRCITRLVLKPHQWQVIELAYWYGYTAKEIAARLDLPIGTVKSRIRQSLIALRPLFTSNQRADSATQRSLQYDSLCD